MKNKNLIKAMAIGISASMALQPVTVLADETTPVTGDLGGDDSHVSEPAQNPVEKSFDDTQAVVVEAEKAVQTAETQSGVTADNKGSIIAWITGDVTTADELIDEAKDDVDDAKKLALDRDEAIADMDEAITGENQFNDNIADAKTDFATAESAASEAQGYADQVTEDTTQAEAEQLIASAEAKYEEATQALEKAEGEYDVAKKAYDVAFKKYMEASMDGSLTYLELQKAENELAYAKKLVADKEKVVEGLQADAEAALENMLKEDYSKIQDSKDKLAKDETTKEAHAELLITAYVKANAGKFTEKDGFSTERRWFVTDHNEDGTDAKDYTDYKTVTYTDANGQKVTELYTVAVDENGEVVVNRVTVEEVEDRDNEIEAAVEAKAAVEESWKTADGSKTFVNTETTHTVAGENGTFYAIDTAISTDVSSDADKAVKAPETIIDGNKTTTYEEVEGSENTSYIKTTYTVVDSYNKKVGSTDKKKAKNANELKNLVNSYQGQDVKVTVHILGIGFLPSYDVDPNKPDWFDKFNAWIGHGYNVEITNYVDDLDSPKDTHEEDGIYEVVTKSYVKTETTVVTNSEDHACWNENDAISKCYAAVSRLEEQGFEVDYDNSGWYKSWGTWHYVVNYSQTTTNISTVENVEVSRTKYAADYYNDYTAPQLAVEGKDAVYGTKLSETTGASMVESDLSDKLEAQAEKVRLQNIAVEQAKAATGAYNDAVEAVEKARAKVADLKSKNTPVVTLAAAQAELRAAMKKLGTTYIAKNKAEKAVEDAEAAVQEAKEDLQTIIDKNKPSGNQSTGGDEPTGGNDTTTDDTTGGTTNPTGTNAVASNTANGGQEVLGAVRSSGKKSAAASSTKAVVADSANNTTDSSNAAVAEDTTKAEEKKETTTVDTTTTIVDEATAQAATPIEQQSRFPWWVLVILAAIAGVSVEEYVRRNNSKEKVKADNSKKNK